MHESSIGNGQEQGWTDSFICCVDMKEIDKSVRHWRLTGSDRFRWFDCCSTRMNDWVRTIDEVLHLVFLLKHFWSRLTKWQFFCYVSTTTHKNLNFHKILKFSITKIYLHKFFKNFEFFYLNWISADLVSYQNVLNGSIPVVWWWDNRQVKNKFKTLLVIISAGDYPLW